MPNVQAALDRAKEAYAEQQAVIASRAESA
jgi:hypothetical protein